MNVYPTLTQLSGFNDDLLAVQWKDGTEDEYSFSLLDNGLTWNGNFYKKGISTLLGGSYEMLPSREPCISINGDQFSIYGGDTIDVRYFELFDNKIIFGLDEFQTEYDFSLTDDGFIFNGQRYRREKYY